MDLRTDLLNLLKILESDMASGVVEGPQAKFHAVNSEGTGLSQEVGPDDIDTHIKAWQANLSWWAATRDHPALSHARCLQGGDSCNC